MKWADLKTKTVGELVDVCQAIEEALQGVEGVKIDGVPVKEACKELVMDGLDNGVFRFKEGSLAEQLSDGALAMVSTTTDWEERAKMALGPVFAVLELKPLQHLPG